MRAILPVPAGTGTGLSFAAEYLHPEHIESSDANTFGQNSKGPVRYLDTRRYSGRLS
jgi:hypothetical protein